MTDAMSRREIEDVLSSIRRLVSHDVAPSAASLQDNPAGGVFRARSPSGDKLVLTSALRVDGAAPVQAGKPDQPAPEPYSDACTDTLSGSVHTPFGAARQPLTEAAADMPVSAGSEAAQDLMPEQDPVAVHGSLEMAADNSTPGSTGFLITPSLLARISGAGGPEDLRSDAARVALSPEQNAGISDDAPAVFEDLADMPLSSAPSGTQSDAPLTDPSTFAQSIEDSALETTLDRLEKLLAGTAKDRIAPDAPRDTAEKSEDLIDESVLYQLVAQIVRQELQGELGEKITRNIRKLVRSEVARELQLRKF